MYKLRNAQKVKQLNPKIIGYFGRCFGYCLKQNKGDKLAIKNGLLSIVPHSFEDHSKCSEWCRYKRDPGLVHVQVISKWKTTYRSTPERELSKIFAEYTKSEILERLTCFARHYSGSASLSFRVAASVNQKNEGYGYLENVSMRLGITGKGVLQKYVQVRNLKTRTDKQRKQIKSFKKRRAAKRLSP